MGALEPAELIQPSQLQWYSERTYPRALATKRTRRVEAAMLPRTGELAVTER